MGTRLASGAPRGAGAGGRLENGRGGGGMARRHHRGHRDLRARPRSATSPRSRRRSAANTSRTSARREPRALHRPRRRALLPRSCRSCGRLDRSRGRRSGDPASSCALRSSRAPRASVRAALPTRRGPPRMSTFDFTIPRSSSAESSAGPLPARARARSRRGPARGGPAAGRRAGASAGFASHARARTRRP